MKKSELLSRLPYNLRKQTDSATLELAIMPEDDDFYYGEYQGNTIICDYGLPFEFYSTDSGDFETALKSLLPKATIIGATLMSTVNHYGFALIENGQKTRVKVGDSKMPNAFEMGNPTVEELKLQTNSILNDEGLREFKFDGDDELYLEDTIGVEYVFEVVKRIFGFRLDEGQSDQLLFETQFEKYKKN